MSLCDHAEHRKNVRVISKVAPPLRSHSHKVQVSGNIMIVNNERYKTTESVPYRF